MLSLRALILIFTCRFLNNIVETTLLETKYNLNVDAIDTKLISLINYQCIAGVRMLHVQ